MSSAELPAVEAADTACYMVYVSTCRLFSQNKTSFSMFNLRKKLPWLCNEATKERGREWGHSGNEGGIFFWWSKRQKKTYYKVVIKRAKGKMEDLG